MTRCLLSTALSTALLCLMAAPAAHAQQARNADAGTAATPTELDEVQVRAARRLPAPPPASSFGTASWQQTPASVRVLDRTLLDDRHVRTLSEVASHDASLGDSYAPVGYYQNIAIRGFALDTGTGYQFNGLSTAGEQRVAFENLQRVEVLKGEAGLAAGVMAPGGIINYVSKRAENVRRLTVGTDQEGSRYAAVDVGQWLTPSFGLRFNGAWEDSASYIDHADGRRNFYALAADWLMGARSTLQLDASYQTSAQRSASGYQLLGGVALPGRVDRSHMLGYQAWQAPVAIASTQLAALHTVQWNADWQTRLSVGHSRSVIDDNVAFAYGCFYATACADGSVPGQFFAPDGDYDIYDYRSPDDTRLNQQARAELRGSFQTGRIGHALSVGADVLRRQVDKRRNVNEYVGTANIHDRQVEQFAPSPLQPGASVRRLDSRQDALFVLDRMQLAENWQWLAGGRHVRLDERAFNKRGALERHSRLSRFLPQTALVFQASDQLSAYASYVRGIALGQEAPFWTSNEGTFLAPVLSRQLEAGLKFTGADGLQLGAALFRTSQPFQYARPDDSAAGFSFVQQGQQTHTGLELSADGTLGPALEITASATVLQARARDSGTPAYAGQQLVNVPKVRANLHLDYAVPLVDGLAVSAGWRYAAANPATADGRTRAPAYSVFDAGLRLRHALHGNEVTWRLSVDNVFNRFYWRDTGSSAGDYYLFPGAPRQARLTMTLAL